MEAPSEEPVTAPFLGPVAAPLTESSTTPLAEPVPPLAPPLAVGDQPAAEAAVRWRMAAATIDNLLVYVVYLGLCALFHWKVLSVGPLIVLLGLGVVYHFALESRNGQTLGKLRYGIRVVSVHGGPATPKGIALRSLLRAIDALPLGYLSGLISMVRTGPKRRQRIGDVAGETMVIAVGGRSAQRGTPGWLLPAATILALAYSVVGVYAVAGAGHKPLSGTQEAQFVQGCEESASGAVLNCQCLLNRLEADGYNTLSSLQSLYQQAQNEELYGQSGKARSELTTDALGCRK